MSEAFYSGLAVFGGFWYTFLFFYLIDHLALGASVHVRHRALAFLLIGSITTALLYGGIELRLVGVVQAVLHLFYCHLTAPGSKWLGLLWPAVYAAVFLSVNSACGVSSYMALNIEAVAATQQPIQLVAALFYCSIIYLYICSFSPRRKLIPLTSQILSISALTVCVAIIGIFIDWTKDSVPQADSPQMLLLVSCFMATTIAWYILWDLLLQQTIKTYTGMLEENRGRSEQQSTENLQLLNERLRGLRHDLHNQLYAISGFIKQGDLPGLTSYFSQLSTEALYNDSFTLTNLPQLDALLRAKMLQAASLRVRTDIFLVVPGFLPLSSLDLCSVLGNVLDNALEATRQLPEEQRFISLQSATISNMWLITVKNSCNGNYRYDHESELLSTKNDFSHGVGLKRVRNLTEQNNGAVFIAAEADYFSIEIVLPWSTV